MSAAYHLLILEGLQLQAQGWQARREVALALRRDGMRPPEIARELARRALEAGCEPEDLERLGISVHNVRVMLRQRVET
jgi:hypothetical protein